MPPGFIRFSFNAATVHETRVHYSSMKNITLSAEEDLIERARDVARARHTTLNSAFREWLQHFAAGDADSSGFDALMQQMSHIDSAGPYSRDELNTR